MDEYIELLVLVYFRDHVEDYSFSELREMIGISYIQLDEILDHMIFENKLVYEDFVLKMSFEGRMMLMKSSMEDYRLITEVEIDSYFFKTKWPMDKPFYVSGFSKKKWRNA